LINIRSKGNYLASASDAELLSYFPASALSIDAAPRFADLFLTRSKWKAEEISPFLTDIAIDSKERDKLLLKFARTTTDAQGVWYTTRAQFNG
jgi:sister chromatid cohesion protein DCC1